MRQDGCSLCVGAMPEGEWCRACGAGLPEPEPDEPKSRLWEAIDRARYPDPVEFINAYNEARRRHASRGQSGESAES